MKGLILDTSTNKAVLGVMEGEVLVNTILFDGGKGLTSILFPALEPLIQNLSYIAVGVGPGSYMGVRTGATVAKTLTYALDIPIIEFSSILVSLPQDLNGPFIFVGDAKMGELFLIEGKASEGKVRNLTAPKLIAKANLDSELKKQAVGLKPIDPHLTWVIPQVLDALSQNQTSHPETLFLQYIR